MKTDTGGRPLPPVSAVCIGIDDETANSPLQFRDFANG
jgi:hypothetical protein